MTHTYRRRVCQYDYVYALWDIEEDDWDPKSVAVRQRLARFHSDSFSSWRKGPPRNFRKVDDRKLRRGNQVALKHWLHRPYSEPLFMDIRRSPAWLPM